MKKNKPITVRRCARPIIHKTNSDKVVLAVHGYTGYPGELAYPAKRFIEEGWDVCIPRLSGHGTCGNDLRYTGVSHWQRQVADAFANLQSYYRHVCVLGHSMGGLLALDLALHQQPTSLALLAPCIGFYPKSLLFIRPVSFFTYRIPKKWERDPEFVFYDDRDEDDDEYLAREYWRWRWTRVIADLFRLEKKVQKSLPKITAPVLGIFAKEDQTVGYGGLKALESFLKSPFQGILLYKCSHFIPYDKHPGNKEKAMDLTIQWFEDSLK